MRKTLGFWDAAGARSTGSRQQAPVRQARASDLVRVNARLSWEFRPLSFVYSIVKDTDFRESPRRERGALLKVNWTRQF